MVFVQSSSELDIAANGIDRFADSKANQLFLEFDAEITKNIQEAALFAMGSREEVVDFVDHDHPKPEVAKKANNADLKRGDTLGPQA